MRRCLIPRLSVTLARSRTKRLRLSVRVCVRVLVVVRTGVSVGVRGRVVVLTVGCVAGGVRVRDARVLTEGEGGRLLLAPFFSAFTRAFVCRACARALSPRPSLPSRPPRPPRLVSPSGRSYD